MTVLERIDAAVDRPAASRTVLPRVVSTPTPPHDLRRLGGWSRDDLMAIGGAAVSALCTTRLLFGVLTPLAGPFGFVVVAYILFNAVYALLVSLTEDRPAVVDRVMSVLMASAAVVAVAALASVVLDTLWKGRLALLKTNVYRKVLETE